MTVSTTSARITYNGDGVSTTFYTPYFLTNTDLKVYVDDVLQALTTDYTVSGAGVSAGGSVIFVTAPQSGATVIILRDPDSLQQTQLPANDPFPSKAVETAFDKLTMLVQRLLDKSALAVTMSDSGAYSGPVLTPPGAGEYIRWNLTGTGLDSTDAVYDTGSFLQSGAGAVSRTAQSKMGEWISVTDFGAVGNGIADDTTKVQNAVSAAYAAGAVLYWPAGTYLTSSSVTNLHGVRHLGTGIIKRGSDLFYVDPYGSQVNVLYVATTGSDGHDGLSASQPMLTIQNAFDKMFNYGPVLDGAWTVKLAAGTYTSETYVRNLRSQSSITLAGPSVGGSPNVPTAIIDGTTPGSRGIGLYFKEYMDVSVRDIKIQNWPASTGLGLIFDYHCVGFTTNVHTYNCGYAGIQISILSRGAVSGGIHDGAVYGILVYSQSLATIGYGGGPATNRPLIKNAAAAGILCSGGFGHADYCDMQSNARNVYLANVSRLHVMGCAMSGASTADVVIAGASTWLDDTTIPNTFSSVTQFVHGAGCMEQSDWFLQQYDKTNHRFKWGEYSADATGFMPISDNSRTLGSGGNRWSTVYAGTGAINTSDAREKRDVSDLSAAELRVARTIKGLFRKFRFRSSVDKKGAAARTHVGVVAQDVKAAFEAEGLDGFQYGILCYDEWDEQPEILDDDGNILQPYVAAGNRYGLRYDEMFCFLMACV